ncbi:MAG TPA: YidC/Oxa1 family membrane protein insertase [Feifaniaceae bacterium]|nr:YidC/Oxa1 family membrane protein insertase [Feifaniaceae bacterium]
MQGDFFLTTWILLGMRWLYENVTAESIFWTILISTVIIRGITVFGDIQSRKSSMKMQVIQPDLDKLRKKYGNDPQKLQQAQSKLMKERGVSMWGGCLPMLIMMPLFFCFIAAFRFWGYEQMIKVLLELHETGNSTLFQNFNFLWVHNIWMPDNGLKEVVMTAQEFLAIPDLQNLIFFQEHPEALATFQQLGFIVADPKNIPQTSIDTYNNLIAPLVAQYQGVNNGWFIWPILAGGTTFLSSWIMQKNQPKPAAQDGGQNNAAAQAQSTNKAMLYIMPAMSAFFCFSNNTAFAIYWTASNVLSTCTNLLLNRKFAKELAASKPEEGNS